MKVKRTDIPQKRRFVDTQSESNGKPVHSVEVGSDFITLFCKDSQSEFWNDGTIHNPKRFHCEVEPNLWIDHQFPGKSSEGWSQHIHLLIDSPTWADFDKYLPHMSGALADAIKASYEE